MSTFHGLLNVNIAVTGFTATGEDAGGQPTGSFTSKGTVKGRIEPRGGPGGIALEVVNGPDLNPVISDFFAITELPVGFEIIERDVLTDDTGAYEALAVGTFSGRAVPHHLELALRRVA